MGRIKTAFVNLLRRGGLAFSCFPASMFFAVILAVISIWIVYADPDTNEKLWMTIRLAALAASVFGIGSSVLFRKIFGDRRSLVFSSGITLLFGVLSFLGLYLFRGTADFPDERMLIWALGLAVISFFAFLAIPAYSSSALNYNDMFFMNIKSFFISVVYAGVLFAGFAFVALAVQTLLWDDLDEKIYMYILILSLLSGFTFFLGYFPDFNRTENEGFVQRARIASNQPKFAQVLFQKIMIPIVGALSLVLLIWSIKILISGDWPEFGQIVGIFTTYSLSVVVLYLLVSSYEDPIVKLYKRIIPVCALVFLGFETYPIYTRIAERGLTPGDYSVIILWIFAVVVLALFIFIPITKNTVVSYTAGILIFIMMLPGIGLMDAPFYYQTARLRSVLKANDMLTQEGISPDPDISSEDKVKVTQSIEYIFSDSGKKLPDWIGSSMDSLKDFESAFGFSQMYDPGIDPEGPAKRDEYYSVSLKEGPVLLDGYNSYIPRSAFYENEKITLNIDGTEYIIEYAIDREKNAAGKIRVTKGKTLLIEADLEQAALDLFDDLFTDSEALEKGQFKELLPDDLSLRFTYMEADVKIILGYLEFRESEDGIQVTASDIHAVLFGVRD